jgi:hypothetical protein
MSSHEISFGVFKELRGDDLPPLGPGIGLYSLSVT